MSKLIYLFLLAAFGVDASEFALECTQEAPSKDKALVFLKKDQKDMEGIQHYSLVLMEKSNPKESQMQSCIIDESGKTQDLMNNLDEQTREAAKERVVSGNLDPEDFKKGIEQINEVAKQRNQIIDSDTSTVLRCDQGPISMMFAFDAGPSAMWFCVGGAGCGETAFITCEDYQE